MCIDLFGPHTPQQKECSFQSHFIGVTTEAQRVGELPKVAWLGVAEALRQAVCFWLLTLYSIRVQGIRQI